MDRSPKFLYTLVTVVLVFVLAGCALQRDDSDATNAEPLSNGLPPTLAPLGADSSEVVAADVSANPTSINVDATATTSALAVSSGVENTQPTNQPVVELSSEAVPNTNQVENTVVEPETFVPPSAEQASTTQPVIVNAPAEELPSGGPIAVNPPASETAGSYAAPISGDGEIVVQAGDTLFGLALAYGTSVQAIMQANGLNSETIYDGQSLTLPGYDGSYTVPSGPGNDTYYPDSDGEYVVAPGETLFSIAARYGTTVEALAIANGLSQPYIIYAGQSLTIATMPGGYGPAYEDQPTYGGYDAAPGYGGYGSHTVAPGETLFFIAQQYGVTTRDLAAANGLANANQIQAGQVLTIPAPY